MGSGTGGTGTGGTGGTGTGGSESGGLELGGSGGSEGSEAEALETGENGPGGRKLHGESRNHIRTKQAKGNRWQIWVFTIFQQCANSVLTDWKVVTFGWSQPLVEL